MDPTLSIAVVAQDRDRAPMIGDDIRDAGAYEISLIGVVTGLERRLAALARDVVLICHRYEIAGVFGASLEALAHKEFGDGIMSAVDFNT